MIAGKDITSEFRKTISGVQFTERKFKYRQFRNLSYSRVESQENTHFVEA